VSQIVAERRGFVSSDSALMRTHAQFVAGAVESPIAIVGTFDATDNSIKPILLRQEAFDVAAVGVLCQGGARRARSLAGASG
jgi:hypothetical protein